ncbi:MAG: hypothetical protein KTR32_39045 [Granulosicoccus sp.]|nr:hypothetical protein [Granulosicoccus sp.]
MRLEETYSLELRMPFEQNTIMSKVIASWLAVCLAILGCGTGFAQAPGADFEPPIIELEQVDTGVLGETQSISVTAVDNDEIDSVVLYYRFGPTGLFATLGMQEVLGSSRYSASVETVGVTENQLQYYIQAIDVSQNVVLKGFAFEPLIRKLESKTIPAIAATQTEPPVPATSDEQTEPVTEKKINFLYVALGVLAVGAIASAAGGGGGNTPVNDQPGECSVCQVTITVAPF